MLFRSVIFFQVQEVPKEVAAVSRYFFRNLPKSMYLCNFLKSSSAAFVTLIPDGI